MFVLKNHAVIIIVLEGLAQERDMNSEFEPCDLVRHFPATLFQSLFFLGSPFSGPANSAPSCLDMKLNRILESP